MRLGLRSSKVSDQHHLSDDEKPISSIEVDSVLEDGGGGDRMPQIVALKSKNTKVHTALIQNAGLAATDEDLLESSVLKELSPRRG